MFEQFHLTIRIKQKSLTGGGPHNIPFVRCVKRGKNGGIFFCNGCQRTLCFKHVNEHRDEIEKQFEDLINQKNQIENDISIRDDSQYLFNEIEQWKRENIE
ncbi:unnamed protein product, partial [Rotaria magnacalcarata]